MDELDLLLARAAEEVERQKKERRKTPGTYTGAFVESDFRAVAQVVMMNRITCHRCGLVEHQLEGLFEERAHRTRPTELHMVRLPILPTESTLPKVRRYREHAIAYCVQCVGVENYKEKP